MACVLYGDDGKAIKATGLIRGKRLVGTWRLFDDAGALRREIDTTPHEVKQSPTHDGLEYRLGRVLFETDAPALPTPPQLEGIDAIAVERARRCVQRRRRGLPAARARARVARSDGARRTRSARSPTRSSTRARPTRSTAAVIPWFARLLSHPHADRSALLGMMQTCGDASAAYIDDLDEDDEDELDERDEDDAEDDDQDDDDDNDYRLAIGGTYAAVGEAWPQIWATFPTADEDDRRVILVLAKFAPGSRAMVADVARNDPDPGMRACAVDSLTSTKNYDVADALPSLADRDPLVRAATAIAIACSKGPSVAARGRTGDRRGAARLARDRRSVRRSAVHRRPRAGLPRDGRGIGALGRRPAHCSGRCAR